MRKFQTNRGPKKRESGTEWESSARQYHEYIESPNTLQKTVVYPGVKQLLEPKAGEVYVDIACGEGAFAEYLAKAEKKAKVVGFDVSTTFIQMAQHRNVSGTEFLRADAGSASRMLNGRMFDGAVCVLAVQNMSQPEQTFMETAKFLKPGAKFVIVLNHPAFRIPRQTMWEYDEKKRLQYRRIERYLSPMDIPILMRPGSDRNVKTVSHHHPISFYVNELARAGFLVDAMEEWTSDRQSVPGGRARAENRSRSEIPLFLAIRARRLDTRR